jgi:hypothetical protein
LRTTQVNQLSAQLREGQGGGLKTAQTVLRLRSMTRVYERAARQECQWVQEKDVDTDALRSTVSENLGGEPVLPSGAGTDDGRVGESTGADPSHAHGHTVPGHSSVHR